MRRLKICLGLAAALLAIPVAAQDKDTPQSQTVEESYPEPPPIISERIIDGRFEPGNLEYLRGAFPEASEEDKAAYASIEAWLDQCYAEGTARLEQEMEELGVALEGETIKVAADLCLQVPNYSQLSELKSYAELEEGIRGARLVFSTMVMAIDRFEQRAGPFSDEETGVKIHALTYGDQLLRNGFRLAWSPIDLPRTPKMTREERAVFGALLQSEVMVVDQRNTNWLKNYVAENGWPTISQTGRRGASAAWLLTQHADLDPAFQLRALRMMEPLVAQDEVSKTSYAYLYDRIMLKLKGKQRYATQVTCEGGERVARPLEEPDRVDELRAEMGMGTFAEYLTRFRSGC